MVAGRSVRSVRVLFGRTTATGSRRDSPYTRGTRARRRERRLPGCGPATCLFHRERSGERSETFTAEREPARFPLYRRGQGAKVRGPRLAERPLRVLGGSVHAGGAANARRRRVGVRRSRWRGVVSRRRRAGRREPGRCRRRLALWSAAWSRRRSSVRRLRSRPSRAGALGVSVPLRARRHPAIVRAGWSRAPRS